MLLFLLGCDDLGVITDVAPAPDTAFARDTGGPVACLPDAVVTTLQGHLQRLDVAARSVPSPPSDVDVPMFFELAGISDGPAWLLSLPAPCPDGDPGPPICDDLVCYTPRCSDGGGWAVDAGGSGTTNDGWTMTDALQSFVWQGDAATYALSAHAGNVTSPDGADWTMETTGSFDGALQIVERYPFLSDGGEVIVDVDGATGTVWLGDEAVATWDGAVLDAAVCAD